MANKLRHMVWHTMIIKRRNLLKMNNYQHDMYIPMVGVTSVISTARQRLNSSRSPLGRSVDLTLVTKRSRQWPPVTDFHPFCLKPTDSPISEFFHKLTMKIQGQTHACRQSSRSRCCISNQSIYFLLFHVNRPCHYWDTAISKCYLENASWRSRWR